MSDATILDTDVRADVAAAHVDFIAGLAHPGTWWTGAQRLEIAGEVRRARRHRELPPWQAPSSIDGMVGDNATLPDGAIDAVWRIANHAGTLTEHWYQAIVERLPVLQYVELVGIVAGVVAVDQFAETLGIAAIALPDPIAGAPSRIEVDATVSRHWVPTGPSSGANVLRAMSAVPAAWESVRAISSSHYVPEDKISGDVSWDRGVLSRAQIEFIAAMTSQLNGCFY